MFGKLLHRKCLQRAWCKEKDDLIVSSRQVSPPIAQSPCPSHKALEETLRRSSHYSDCAGEETLSRDASSQSLHEGLCAQAWDFAFRRIIYIATDYLHASGCEKLLRKVSMMDLVHKPGTLRLGEALKSQRITYMQVVVECFENYCIESAYNGQGANRKMTL